jgi:hypothetical protein
MDSGFLPTSVESEVREGLWGPLWRAGVGPAGNRSPIRPGTSLPPKKYDLGLQLRDAITLPPTKKYRIEVTTYELFGHPDGLMEPWERREVWSKARASSPKPSIKFASQRERKEVNTRPCCS